MSATAHLVGGATNADSRTRLNSEAQLVMDGISRQIRAATYAANGFPSLEPVAFASADEITFYASLLPNSLNDGPVKFDVTLSGSDLVGPTLPSAVRRLWPPTLPILARPTCFSPTTRKMSTPSPIPVATWPYP
jgi:hypothetical protein